MARKSSKNSRPAPGKKSSTRSSKTAKRPKNPRRLSGKQESERIRAFDAANLYRKGAAKTVSEAARMAGTKLTALWRWISGAIEKDARTVGNPVEGERDSGLKPNTIPL